jgi:hypothetical protein
VEWGLQQQEARSSCKGMGVTQARPEALQVHPIGRGGRYGSRMSQVGFRVRNGKFVSCVNRNCWKGSVLFNQEVFKV